MFSVKMLRVPGITSLRPHQRNLLATLGPEILAQDEDDRSRVQVFVGGQSRWTRFPHSSSCKWLEQVTLVASSH